MEPHCAISPLTNLLLQIYVEIANNYLPKPSTDFLAQRLRCSADLIKKADFLLIKRGDIIKESKAGRSRVFVKSIGKWTDTTKPTLNAVSGKAKMRKCMNPECRKSFLSHHAGNRFCENCRERRSESVNGLPDDWVFVA